VAQDPRIIPKTDSRFLATLRLVVIDAEGDSLIGHEEEDDLQFIEI